ncbi:MAG TPA: hypothetical protein VMV03_14715 [Spirochaetia bacterium]|nr:hypothetical protein [Spirochaetia bacterium]
MAVRALRLLAVAAAVALLGSCQVLEFIFSSVFPSTVTLAKARADLSGSISSSDGSSFNVRLVETGGFGYVIVIGSQVSSGNTAYIYDLDLNQKLVLTGITAPSGNGTPGVMVDFLGRIIVGSLAFNPDLSSAGTINPNFIGNNGSGGLNGFVGGGSMIGNLSLSSGSLSWTNFGSSWPASASPTSFPAFTTNTSAQLTAVLDDGVAAGYVALVMNLQTNSNSATCYFVWTLKSNFPSSAIPSMDTAPHRDNIDKNSLGFAQGSVFAFDASSSSFLRIDPTTGGIQSSFFVGSDPSETKFAYRASGGSFYGFDTKSRALTKYASWW